MACQYDIYLSASTGLVSARVTTLMKYSTSIRQLAILPEMRGIKDADVYEYIKPLITKQIR